MEVKTCLRLIRQSVAFLQKLPPADVSSLENGAKTIEISLSKGTRKPAKACGWEGAK